MATEDRIKQLKEGKAVVVNVRKEGGVYRDPVATWAEENDLLTYCGNSTRKGHARTPWFNPHHKQIEAKGRDWVCDKFEAEVLPGLDLSSLKGRALGCWCFPERCHCDSIAAKVNGFGIGHNSNALEDIATRARLALEQVDAGEKMTMEGWLQYGAALNEGREMFSSDEKFGQWVRASQLETHGRDDRAAAMWAAANPEEFEAIKEANPRVRTVRGLHAKWKEERKANQTAQAEYGVVHDVAATEAQKVCNVDDAILEFNNLSDEEKVERLGGKAKVDAARQRKLDETLESDYDPSNGATSMLITLHRVR